MRYFEGLKQKKTLYSFSEHTRAKNNAMACSLEMHIQPGIELIYVTDGIFDVHINAGVEKITKGEAALIFPFQPHGYERYEGTEYLRFDFDQELARDFFKAKNNLIGKKAVFKLSNATIGLITENVIKSNNFSRLSLQAVLYSVLCDFTNQIELISRDKDDDILIKTINYLEENKEKDLHMRLVAKALGYSESYLSRTINKSAGLGFNALLAMVRIEKAKILLAETRKTILEIVIECGFGSERSFYRQFTDSVGKSPLKYRNEINKR